METETIPMKISVRFIAFQVDKWCRHGREDLAQEAFELCDARRADGTGATMQAFIDFWMNSATDVEIG